MADIDLDTGITISNVNKDIAIPAFLAACPMPQINDPAWVPSVVGEKPAMIDEYATPRLYVEAYLKAQQKRILLKRINEGIDILNRTNTQPHLKEL